jgi:hypothetical protein
VIAAPVVEEQIYAIVASRMDLPGPSKFRNSAAPLNFFAPLRGSGSLFDRA